MMITDRHIMSARRNGGVIRCQLLAQLQCLPHRPLGLPVSPRKEGDLPQVEMTGRQFLAVGSHTRIIGG